MSSRAGFATGVEVRARSGGVGPGPGRLSRRAGGCGDAPSRRPRPGRQRPLRPPQRVPRPRAPRRERPALLAARAPGTRGSASGPRPQGPGRTPGRPAAPALRPAVPAAVRPAWARGGRGARSRPPAGFRPFPRALRSSFRSGNSGWLVPGNFRKSFSLTVSSVFSFLSVFFSVCFGNTAIWALDLLAQCRFFFVS